MKTQEKILLMWVPAIVPVLVLVLIASMFLLGGCTALPPEGSLARTKYEYCYVPYKNRCQRQVAEEYTTEWAVGLVDMGHMMAECAVFARRACK